MKITIVYDTELKQTGLSENVNELLDADAFQFVDALQKLSTHLRTAIGLRFAEIQPVLVQKKKEKADDSSTV